MYVAPFASLPPLSDKRSRAWADASGLELLTVLQRAVCNMLRYAKHVTAKPVEFYIEWSCYCHYLTYLLRTMSSHRANTKARHLESRLRGLTEEPTRQTGLPDVQSMPHIDLNLMLRKHLPAAHLSPLLAGDDPSMTFA